MVQEERTAIATAAPRYEMVDLLRGLSILAVVLLHCWIRFGGSEVRMGTRLPEVLASFDFSEWWERGHGILRDLRFSDYLNEPASIWRARSDAGCAVLPHSLRPDCALTPAGFICAEPSALGKPAFRCIQNLARKECRGVATGSVLSPDLSPELAGGEDWLSAPKLGCDVVTQRRGDVLSFLSTGVFCFGRSTFSVATFWMALAFSSCCCAACVGTLGAVGLDYQRDRTGEELPGGYERYRIGLLDRFAL
jgi:hypothetical protein